MTFAAENSPKADAPSEFRVHNLFQSNMVIQRAKPVDVWGWSKPGDRITITFAGKTATGTAGNDGAWKATLPAMEASAKPASMTIEGKDVKITLENVLIGDIWVVGGQSNMEFRISGVDDGDLEVASANFPEIRLLSIPKILGPELKKDFPRAAEFSRLTGGTTIDGDWQVCSPETVGGFSAIGYVMARRIHMVTQFPIGVINTSRGGTLVEAWTPETRLRKMQAPEAKEMLAQYDDKVAAYDPKADLAKQVEKYESKIADMKEKGKKIPDNMKPPTMPSPGPLYSHNRPGNCYASVISPIAGFAVKGAIFHQGYNNCFAGVRGSKMYRVVFPEMIRGWRAAFNDPEMPFGILSQCTAGKVQDLNDFLPYLTDIGARIREAHYQTFLEFYKAGDKNIGFASTYDLRHTSYHPRVKIPAGERIARWALATQYGLEGKFTWLPPMIKEMKVQDGAIFLTFEGKGVTATGDGAPMAGFAIAGEDMKFQPAEVSNMVIGKKGRSLQYDNTIVVLKSPLVPEPVHYRYAWGRSPMGNIQARDGRVPLATQRSDKWTNADLLKALTGLDAEDPGQLSRGEGNALRNALASEDHRRKIAEAQALLEQEKKAGSK
jgi:sialate O-acetylesterase